MYNAGNYMVSPKSYNLTRIEEIRNNYFFGGRAPKAINDFGRFSRSKARESRK